MKSVQDWRGDSIPVRTFADALDIACLIGGINPAADDERLLLRGALPASREPPIPTWSS